MLMERGMIFSPDSGVYFGIIRAQREVPGL